MCSPFSTLKLSVRGLLLATFLMAAGGGVAEAANYVVFSEHGGTLQEAVDDAGNQGMLIVDILPPAQIEPLVLPRFFRLQGMGPQGQAAIFFDIDSGPGIYFSGPESTSSVVIENIDIGGRYPAASPGNSMGIDVSGVSDVTLRNVTVRGFDVGIRGKYAFYVNVRDSNVSLNRRYNYHLIDNANSWRISGGLSSQSGEAAVRIEHSNNVIISGVAFESNAVGVWADTESIHLLNNRFECSPAIPLFCPPDAIGVRVDPGANFVSLFANYYSGVEPLLDLSGGGVTQRLDHSKGAYFHPQPGMEGLRIELAAPEDRLVFDSLGRLRIGEMTPAPLARLNVDAPLGEDALKVGVDGTTDFFVGSDGRVGVGTTAPAEALHVDGNIHLDGNLVSDGPICIGSGC